MPPLESLSLERLRRLPPDIARPPFDPRTLRVGIVHLGLGAFHRAHQAVYTEDAIIEAGGDWGILGVSLRHADVSDALVPQDCLYAVETLEDIRSYRVIGALRSAIAALFEPHIVLQALASPQVHIVTLTVTEKGYAFTPEGSLDTNDPSVCADLRGSHPPSSTIGWLVQGLAARRKNGAVGLTVISCDNLMRNGDLLARAVGELARARAPDLACWIEDNVCFPNAMVDSITPASDEALRGRVASALGLRDRACVQREPFRQWVIEDRFAGPRPAWDAAGVELVADAIPYQKLKLYVLNTANSALAYLGLLNGYTYAHEAFADPQIAAFVDGLITEEMSAAFPELAVTSYWTSVRPRLSNPLVRHKLRQIGEDGSKKLAQRIYGSIRNNLSRNLPCIRMMQVFHAWLAAVAGNLAFDPHEDFLKAWHRSGACLDKLFAHQSLLPRDFREDMRVRSALRESADRFLYAKGKTMLNYSPTEISGGVRE